MTIAATDVAMLIATTNAAMTIAATATLTADWTPN